MPTMLVACRLTGPLTCEVNDGVYWRVVYPPVANGVALERQMRAGKHGSIICSGLAVSFV